MEMIRGYEFSLKEGMAHRGRVYALLWSIMDVLLIWWKT